MSALLPIKFSYETVPEVAVIEFYIFLEIKSNFGLGKELKV